MRIGNTRISGISKKFWFILTAVIIMIVAAIALAPHSAPKETWLNPAFSESNLSSPALSSDSWINSYEDYYNHGKPLTASSPAAFINNYTANVGKPFRFEVYLDTVSDAQSQRPDLVFDRDNYVCDVGFFLAPNQPYTQEALSNVSLGNNTDPLQLCFRADAAPATGQAYDITALLWWSSALFNPPTQSEIANAGGSLAPAPTLLVSDAMPLDAEELANPATNKVNLNLVYEERGYQLTVRDIEWRANIEVRACVSLTNLTNSQQPMWQGISASTAQDSSSQGTVNVTTDNNGPFANGSGDLLPNQTETGWLIFDGPQASNPLDGLNIQMPSLQPDTSSTGGDAISINVQPSQIQTVSQSVTPESSCTGTGTDLSATGTSGTSTTASTGTSTTSTSSGTYQGLVPINPN